MATKYIEHVAIYDPERVNLKQKQTLAYHSMMCLIYGIVQVEGQ